VVTSTLTLDGEGVVSLDGFSSGFSSNDLSGWSPSGGLLATAAEVEGLFVSGGLARASVVLGAGEGEAVGSEAIRFCFLASLCCLAGSPFLWSSSSSSPSSSDPWGDPSSTSSPSSLRARLRGVSWEPAVEGWILTMGRVIPRSTSSASRLP
jgi:hypothetical protein